MGLARSNAEGFVGSIDPSGLMSNPAATLVRNDSTMARDAENYAKKLRRLDSVPHRRIYAVATRRYAKLRTVHSGRELHLNGRYRHRRSLLQSVKRCVGTSRERSLGIVGASPAAMLKPALSARFDARCPSASP